MAYKAREKFLRQSDENRQNISAFQHFLKLHRSIYPKTEMLLFLAAPVFFTDDSKSQKWCWSAVTNGTSATEKKQLNTLKPCSRLHHFLISRSTNFRCRAQISSLKIVSEPNLHWRVLRPLVALWRLGVDVTFTLVQNVWTEFQVSGTTSFEEKRMGSN